MATQRPAKTAAGARKPTTRIKPSTPARSAAKASKLSDYEGARQLLSRYCALIDHGKLVELSELFHQPKQFYLQVLF